MGSVPFSDGIKHSHNVFGGHIGLDVVDLLKYATAPWGQNVQVSGHVLSNLVRGALRKHAAGVTTTSP